MTQMQQALDGAITEVMIEAARHEGVEPELIREGLAAGTLVIPRNNNRDFPARAVGKGTKTKVNANIGTSADHNCPDEELEKLQVCIESGADSVMDLSTGPGARDVLDRILSESPVMVGTVPLYLVMADLMAQNIALREMTGEMLFEEIERQAKAGVDFMTLHCGVCRKTLPFIDESIRTAGIVSRGGSLIRQWMIVNDKENPLYEDYDRLLDIAFEHDVTLSLGDGMRPGGQADSTDRAQLAELMVLGELVERARERGVQVMVEGPGHLPLNHVEANVTLQKQLCKGAPFYVLGPLVTDIAPGYDHIAGAIGGAVAASAGADFLCYVTPAEHLCLPNEQDVRDGVMASRIAAHAADIVKGVAGAAEQDRSMSRARKSFDWESQFDLALDGERARTRRAESESNEEDHCTMCGKLCALRTNRGDNH
ncbi:MAG: phosphomethylpyrimidine synthase ThiC [Spirochaetales bacterium]|nr:phosphomethylpyrimidine synthase ThiC [Spirochaetales bacterium]